MRSKHKFSKFRLVVPAVLALGATLVAGAAHAGGVQWSVGVNLPVVPGVTVVASSPQVIEVVQEGERQIVSVRYHGRIREEQGGPVADFDEVWHLVRFGDQPNWVISGIQQRL